jgi:[ribosomal protein S18]-alanine N-acetyltransferase
MTEGCSVHSLESRDVDRIMPVMMSAFDPDFGEAWTLSQCRGLFSLPGSMLLAVSRADEVCGFAIVRTVVDEAELMLLAVQPQCQSQGIGGLLISHTVAECGNRGIKHIHLEVRESNPAVRFYTKHDFKKTGVRPGYYKSASGKTFDAVTLTRATDHTGAF